MIYDILDKIHCYLYHSYDVGYRLTAENAFKIETANNETMTTNDDSGIKPTPLLRFLHQSKERGRIQTIHQATGNKFHQLLNKNQSPKININQKIIYFIAIGLT